MNADGIDVFHVTDNDRRVVFIPHDFVFDFFVSLYALFDKHLMHGRELEGVFHHFEELLFRFRKAAARTAEGECRAQYDGISDILCRLQPFFHRICDLRRTDGLADTLAQLLEQFPVFGAFDAFALRAEQFRSALAQHPFLFELHGEVQTCLTADGRNDRVRAFVTDDPRNVFEGKRFHIYFIGDLRVRHDRRGVRVAKNDFVTFFFQGEASLRAGVVELRRLTDHDRSAADHHYFFQIFSLRHDRYLLFCISSVNIRNRYPLSSGPGALSG